MGTAGTYTKVTVDSYGRVTGHSTLTQGDIPALSISKITNLQTTLDKKLDKATFEEMFEKVYVSGYGYAIRAKMGFYSEDFVSTKGQNPDAGSTTGGGVDRDEVLQIVEDAGYIKSSALNGYATQSWVNSQGFVKDAFIPRGQVLNSSVDNMGEIGAYIVNENSGLPSGAYEWGTLMTFNSLASGSYGVQMYVEDGVDTKTYLRARYGGSWQSWRMLVETHNIGNYALTPSNYTNYTVTKTGSGASGTWGIAVTGNAGSATKLQTARSINGTAFDGTESITTSKWGMARTLTLKGAVTGSVSIDGSGNVSLETTYATGNIGALDNRYVKDAFIPRGQVLNSSVDNMGEIGAYIVNENSGLPSGAYEWGTLMTFNSLASGSYGVQMYVEDGVDTKTYLRARYGGSWQSWRMLVETHNIGNYALTPSNYTNYTVTKTGGGASGTWGIGISGNAASATKLQTARTLWGQPFDGTGNVNGTLTVNGGIVLPYASGTWLSMATRGDLIRGSVAQSSGGAHSLFRVTAYNGNVLAFGGLGNDVGFYGYSKANIDNNTNNSSFRAIWNMANGNFIFSNNLTVGGYLLANAYVQVGGGRIYWDSTNNALYVQKSDGTQCGFYATGFMSAKGLNSDGGSAVAGATTLNGLSDVTISSPSNGQSLVYRNGVWKNEMVSGGGSASVNWDDINGKPTWIPDTDGSGSGIDADLLDGTHKSGLFTAMTYSGSTLSITIGGTRRTATINASGGGASSVSVSSSSSRNISVTVDGHTDYVSDVYATYLDGTPKNGLFTGMSFTNGNTVNCTIGGVTRSAVLSGMFTSRGQISESLDNITVNGIAVVNQNSGRPPGSYEWGLVLTCINGSYGFQIYIEDSRNTTYVRTRYGGGWKSWSKIGP